jgi:hypothetical protein
MKFRFILKIYDRNLKEIFREEKYDNSVKVEKRINELLSTHYISSTFIDYGYEKKKLYITVMIYLYPHGV